MAGWLGRHKLGVTVAVLAVGGAAAIAAMRAQSPPTAGAAYSTEPPYVSPAAYQQMRDQGYVGYSYGPLARFPGAKGPAPPVPIYGAYGARYALPGERGAPIEPLRTIQSIATRQTPPIRNPPLPEAREARNVFQSEVVGNLYAHIAWPLEIGPRNFRTPVQSVVTAQQAVPVAPSFPWWHPHRQVGPLGFSGLALSDDGGGYVSPGAYEAAAHDARAIPTPPKVQSTPGTVYYEAEHSLVAPGFPTFYRDVSLENSVDIQTQDYPGGEVGYNLSVGNLPALANGNLSAPVTYQELAVGGGIAAGEIPTLSRVRPLLDFTHAF